MAVALIVLYDLLITVALVLAIVQVSIRILKKGGSLSRFADRFGFYPRSVMERVRSSAAGTRIWIHAVSLGEVRIALGLIEEMRRQNRSVTFTISVSTATAWKSAEVIMKRSAGPSDVLVYYPFDTVGAVRRAIKRLRPDAVVVVETEIWPNFIRAASRAGVPFYLVNARMSDASEKGYSRIRFFIAEYFKRISHVYAQSDEDAARFRKAGVPSDRITVGNSFKFDVSERVAAKEDELRRWTGAGRILLGGSIWPGEERILLKTYIKLLPDYPGMRLVLAPRHCSMAAEIERQAARCGLSCCRRSSGKNAVSDTDVLVCDTTGELSSLYAISDVVFIGKTLWEHGGQNMIEPCALGKPVVAGPYTENFRQVMNDLLSDDAVVQVPESDMPLMEESVCASIMRFFNEPETAAEYGHRAAMSVSTRAGATERCARDILGRMQCVC